MKIRFLKTKSGKRELKTLIINNVIIYSIPVVLGLISYLATPKTAFFNFLYISFFVLYILAILIINIIKILIKEKVNDIPFTIHIVQTEDNAKLKLFQSKFTNDILAFFEEKKLNLFLFKNILDWLPGVIFWSFNRTKIKNDLEHWKEYFEDLDEEWTFFIDQISFAASLHAFTHNRKIIVHIIQNCPALFSFYFGYLIGNVDKDLCLYNFGTKPGREEKYHLAIDAINVDLSEFGRSIKIDEHGINDILNNQIECLKFSNYEIYRKSSIDINKDLNLLIHFHYKEGDEDKTDNQITIKRIIPIDNKIEPKDINELYSLILEICKNMNKNEVNIFFKTANAICTSLGFAFSGKIKPSNLNFCQNKDIKFKLETFSSIIKRSN